MAQLPIIRKGDKTSHGGTVLEGFATYTIHGIPAAGKGHMVHCPQCKGTYPIAEGVESFKIDGVPAAVKDMQTTCGAKLIPSQSVFCLEHTSGGAAFSAASSESSGGAADTSAAAAGASAASASSPAKTPDAHDEQTHLHNTETDASVHGLPYFIEAPDGSTHSGVTGEDGLLPRIYTGSEAEYAVYWGDEALAKQYGVEA